MKLAMLRVSKALQKSKLECQMLLQVHDELVLECAEQQLEDCAQLVTKEMEGAFKLKVPLKTDVKWGRNWYEMEELKL